METLRTAPLIDDPNWAVFVIGIAKSPFGSKAQTTTITERRKQREHCEIKSAAEKSFVTEFKPAKLKMDIIYSLIFVGSIITSKTEVEMNTVRKIELTKDQAAWLDSEVSAGNIANENEFISGLISEARLRICETPQQIEKIRELLIEAENNGMSPKSPDEIWIEILEI
jgi:hypothetical protein